ALTFIERAKARALLDLLYSGRVNVVKAMTSREQEQERALRAEIISLNTQVTRAGQQDKPDQARLGELKAQREKVRLSYEAFQTSLYAAHPELRVQRGEAQVIRAEEIAALAPDAGSALLEYVVMDDVTYLFTVTKAAGKAEADVRVYALPIKRDDLAGQVEAFRRQLAGRDLGFRASAGKLYNLLLKPAEAELRDKTDLVIAPDDTLWDLPFQALLTGANRFLIEDAAISYAPSLSVLREMTRRRKNHGAEAAPATLLA
ncbi:MAG: CHAT domain-containing protein, partial [Pyrinomonadaceae bacterium]